MKLKIKSASAKQSPVIQTAISYARFPRVSRPSFVEKISFPEDITELEPANISDLLGKYTLLQSYVSQDLARINVRILHLEGSKARRINEMFRVQMNLNSQERWRRDAIVEDDEQVEEINRQFLRYRTEKTYAEMYVGIYEKYISALSRELTRKLSEVPRINFPQRGQ